MRFIFFGLILSCVPVAGFADPAPSVPQEKKITDRNDPNYVICRRQSVTGYYSVTKKVCRTRAEWILESRNAQDAGRGLQDSGLVNSCSAADRSQC